MTASCLYGAAVTAAACSVNPEGVKVGAAGAAVSFAVLASARVAG